MQQHVAAEVEAGRPRPTAGRSRGLGHARRHVDLEEPDPAIRRRRSGPTGRGRAARAPVRRSAATRAQLRGGAPSDSGAGTTNSVEPGGVAGACSRRRRRPGGSRRRAAPGVPSRRRRPAPRPRRPTRAARSGHRAVGEAADHRARQLRRACATTVQPSAEPPRAGLTTSGSPSRSTSGSSPRRRRAPGTSRPAGSPTRGCGAPARGHHRLGDRLVERDPAAAAARPDERHAEQRRAPRGARRPRRSAVQQRDHAVGPLGAQPAPAARRRRRARPPRARPRSASATRRPERSETSRSCDSPPASTTDRGLGSAHRRAPAQSSGRWFGDARSRGGSERGRARAERRAQLELGSITAGQPADALADPLGRREAVATAASRAAPEPSA